MKLHLLILWSSPEALNKKIVAPASFAIHDYQNFQDFELVCKFGTYKLVFLICVEDLR